MAPTSVRSLRGGEFEGIGSAKVTESDKIVLLGGGALRKFLFTSSDTFGVRRAFKMFCNSI